MNYIRPRALFLSVLLCALACTLFPAQTHATPSTELQESVNTAYAQLLAYTNELETASSQLAELQEELSSLQEDIEDTKADIKEKKKALAQKQDELSEHLSGSYKRGSAGLLAVVFGSSDFNELVSNLFYVNKISENESNAIEAVREAQKALEAKQTELEEQEIEQQELVSAQEQKTAEIEEKATAQQSYYESLDAELQQQLADEAARAAAEQAAAEAAQNETTNNSNNSNTDTPTTDNTNTSNSNTNTSTNTNSGNAPSAVLAYAQSKVGCAYSWGGTGPNSYDCSGLAYMAYKSAGISIGRTVWSQYDAVKNAGHLVTDVANLKAGDLVFFYSDLSHVGIYEGGGTFIHASTYGVGVIRSSLYSNYYSKYFRGGGSPV